MTHPEQASSPPPDPAATPQPPAYQPPAYQPPGESLPPPTYPPPYDAAPPTYPPPYDTAPPTYPPYGAAPPAYQPPFGAAPPAYQPPYGGAPPTYQQPYGAAPTSYQPIHPQAPQPGFGYGHQSGYSPGYYDPYGYPPRPGTDGLAIASLVISCIAFTGLCTSGIGGVLGIVGAILGHVARGRIRRSGSNGAGMALAGIIVGWSFTAISALIAALVITLSVTDPSWLND